MTRRFPYCINFSSSLFEAFIGGVFVSLEPPPLVISHGIPNAEPSVAIASYKLSTYGFNGKTVHLAGRDRNKFDN